MGQIHDMGLTGGVFDDGGPLGQCRRHHNVHGSAHGHHVQIDVGPLQMTVLGPGVDVAALHGHLRAHGGKALDMLVDGPHAEIAAAGHGHRGLAKAAQQRAQQVIAGPDPPRQLIAGAGGTDGAAVQLHRVAVQDPHLRAQLIQNREEQRHIADLGNVLNAAYAVHHQSGRNDGHRRVFRAADRDLTIQGTAAVNDIFIQDLHPLLHPTDQKARGQRPEYRGRTLCPTLIMPRAENFIHHIYYMM